MTFKNIQIKMKGGKSRMQRVKVLASGKFKFVKNLTKRRTTSRTRKANPTRRKGVRRMTRKKRRSGGKSISTQVFKWIRIGALVAPEAAEILQYGLNRDSIRSIISHKTGFNIDTRTFDMQELMIGWGPYLAAVLTTYGIPKLAGIIRRL